MNILTYIKHELYINRKTLLVWTCIVASFSGLFAAFTDVIAGNEAMVDLVKNYPKALLDAFNFNIDSLDTFEGWMSTEPQMFFNLLLASFAALLAGTCIAKELDSRTGEFLFTTPGNRREIFLAKVIANFIQVLIVLLATSALTVGIGLVVSDITNMTGLLAMLTSAFIIALAASGVGYIITALYASDRSALSTSVGFVILSFLLNSLASLDKAISWLADLSIFNAFGPSDILEAQTLPLTASLIMIGIWIFGTVLGMEIVHRKDI